MGPEESELYTTNNPRVDVIFDLNRWRQSCEHADQTHDQHKGQTQSQKASRCDRSLIRLSFRVVL